MIAVWPFDKGTKTQVALALRASIFFCTVDFHLDTFEKVLRIVKTPQFSTEASSIFGLKILAFDLVSIEYVLETRED